MSPDRSARQRLLRKAGTRGFAPRVEQVEARQLLATMTFTVNSTADSGTGTLRQAILNANANPGLDLINFNIPGPGPFSIAPTSDLPPITDPVIIDGTTQPSSPLIELNGSLDTGPGNTGNGLRINAPNSTVRGLVINRFTGFGIAISGATGGTIAGNLIGTDPTGTFPEGNVAGGILVSNSMSLTIGGTAPADRNLISGNRGDGINLSSSNTLQSLNAVLGNRIGTDLTGSSPLPNIGNGVFISSSGNRIGGVNPGEANTIAFNGLAGVRVGTFNFQTGVTSNAIRGNAIFGNNALGIDLGDSGVTPNGSGGTGFGPNRLQSFPVINSAYTTIGGSGTTVEGQLTSTPNSNFLVDLYANGTPDPSGFGQGQQYLGSTTVMTDANGAVSFTASVPQKVPSGQFITATATDLNGDTSEFSADTLVNPAPPADLAVSLGGTPDPVLAGGNLTYTVNVVNKGPSRATNTTVTDVLPAGVTFVSATPSQGNFALNGGTLTANLGNLPSGAGATLQIVVRPAAQGTLPTTITNTVTVKSDQTDLVPQDDTATVTTTVNPPIPADLAVTSFASAPQVAVGKDLTYTIVVTNNGPSSQATGVTLSDQLPTNATFVSAVASQGTATAAGGVLTANLGNLVNGGNAIVQITVRPTSPGQLTNMATAHGDQVDPNFLNNTSTLQTSVTPLTPADLLVSVVALPNPDIGGSPLTYTVTVTNLGPGDATGVTLTDELDSGVTFVSATASQGTATPSGGTVTANLGTVVAGQSALVSIVVQPTTIGTLTNTATVQGDQPDFVPGNNSVTIASQVIPNPNLPTILAQRLIASQKGITAIVLTFSKPMDPVLAGTLNNYSIRLSGTNGLPGAPEGPVIPLASAVYDPLRRTVTLTPKQPLALGQFYQLTANGQGASGLTDTSGNVLDGDQNGLPDGIYKSLIGRGTKVRPLPFQRSQLVPIPPPLAHNRPRAAPRPHAPRPRLPHPRPTAPVQSDVSVTVSLAKRVSRNG